MQNFDILCTRFQYTCAENFNILSQNISIYLCEKFRYTCAEDFNNIHQGFFLPFEMVKFSKITISRKIFPSVTAKKSGNFPNFHRNPSKNKGKIVMEARNMQNFRLRRAKNMFLFANLNQNQHNLAKIAPKGGDFFWDEQIAISPKQIKKH